jgi:hypothetical protein
MSRTISVALALLGALGSAVQSAMLLARGEALCFNEGCRIVESLTRVSPLYINLAGLGFFLAVAALAWRAPTAGTGRRLLGILRAPASVPRGCSSATSSSWRRPSAAGA